jgi:hypothetical protein
MLEASKLPVHNFLVNNLRRLQLDPTWELADDERLQAHCQRLHDGDLYYTLKDEFGFRFHSNLTNSPRGVKDYLRIGGQSIMEIDLANSHPLWDAFQITKRKIGGCEEYVRLCSAGQFYDHFVQYGWTREEVKDEFLQSILFKKNGYNSRIKKRFKQDFPNVAAHWEKCKAKDPANFARLLQRAEAGFMIYTVVDTLRRLNPDMFVATIHDSILTLPEHAGLVKQVINEQAPIPLTIKEKHYGRQN